MIYRKRDLCAHLFFNKRSLLQGRAISRQSQVCASHNFPGRGKIVADRPRGVVLTPEEHLRIFLWEVSEQPLLRDVVKMHLKYDGLSPTVIGHDLNPAGA